MHAYAPDGRRKLWAKLIGVAGCGRAARSRQVKERCQERGSCLLSFPRSPESDHHEAKPARYARAADAAGGIAPPKERAHRSQARRLTHATPGLTMMGTSTLRASQVEFKLGWSSLALR